MRKLRSVAVSLRQPMSQKTGDAIVDGMLICGWFTVIILIAVYF